MSLVSSNRQSRANLRAADPLAKNPEEINREIKATINGATAGTMNAKAKWVGYNSAGQAEVRIANQVYPLQDVHGRTSIPRGTRVVLRAAKNHVVADFQ